MTEKINTQLLFFNRRPNEMARFLPELQAYNRKINTNEWRAAAERMDSFFPRPLSEGESLRIISREDQSERDIEMWRRHGASIFAFRQDLLEMFLHSDIENMPITAIEFPYQVLYLYFGDADPLQGFSEDYRVDGLMITRDDSLVIVRATVIRRDARMTALSSQDILDKPFLNAFYRFDTETTTIAEAIAAVIKEEAHCTPDCEWENLAWEWEDGTVKDCYGNEIDIERGEWRVEETQYSDGSPCYTYYRLNNPLNVCNRPEFLGPITHLVFNALCYLNWKGRDVEERYSDPKFQKEMDSAPRKKQERLRAKASQLGYRKLWFCGYNSPRIEYSHGNGAITTHWRRGHWRTQRYGRGLAETRQTWIRPVIVNQSDIDPTKTLIYR